MKTKHKIFFNDARNMSYIESESVDLMITSPPYPMIEMWDDIFSQQNQKIADALKSNQGDIAFELIHQELDKAWTEVYRVLKWGGIACINIGDATRKVNSSFKLYPNHARILSHCMRLGFHVLPEILWRKQSNKPNKFMGSGMLPVGAYVTLEHEYILILRKGGKKEFKTESEKIERQTSAFFWEERNQWFSDIWEDLKGDKQKLNHTNLRERSGAFPFELPYRLINMYSVQKATVLDPFLGTGTTMLAAMASGRNSIGVEIDPRFKELISLRINDIKELANEHNQSRIKKHLDFIEKRKSDGKEVGYTNESNNLPVMTKQEVNLKLPQLSNIRLMEDGTFEVDYEDNYIVIEALLPGL